MKKSIVAAILTSTALTACLGSETDNMTTPGPGPGSGTTIIDVAAQVQTDLGNAPAAVRSAYSAFNTANGSAPAATPVTGVASFSGDFALVGHQGGAVTRYYEGDMNVTQRLSAPLSSSYLAEMDFQTITNGAGSALSFSMTDETMTGYVGAAAGSLQEIQFRGSPQGTVDGQPWISSFTLTGKWAEGQTGVGTVTGIGGDDDIKGVFTFTAD